MTMTVYKKDGTEWKRYHGIIRTNWDDSRKELAITDRFGREITVGLAEAVRIELTVEGGGQ